MSERHPRPGSPQATPRAGNQRERLLPEILAISPTTLAAWTACRRRYLLAALLRLPASDVGGSPDEGLAAHAVLTIIHKRGTCHDERHVHDTLVGHGLPPEGPLRGIVERHARRCPAQPERSWHEVEVARFHLTPPPMFMGAARLDAVWVHGGILDVRDYKTGRPFHERVCDDPRARLQAWLAAPRAAARGLRLRVRYEFLAAEVDDDPEPFEPDDDELAEIERELVTMAAAVRDERAWRGEPDTSLCGHCRYRSVCIDSATPGEPVWAPPAG